MQVQFVKLAAHVIVEWVGADLLLCSPKSGRVSRITGAHPEVTESLASGGSVPVTSHPDLLSLVQEGTLVQYQGLSRRSLVKAGAIGAGAGIAVLAMPTVAAASSVAFSLVGNFYRSGSNFFFEIATHQSEFPALPPSTDILDVSGLSILGTTLPVAYSDLVGNPRYIGWGSLPGFTSGTQGTFTWVGDDGTTYFYTVTFSIDTT